MNPFCVKLSAPGKVILHGEHAVVFGKTAIAVSVGLRTSICLKKTRKPFIGIDLPSLQINDTISLDIINDHILEYKSYVEEPDSLPHEEHLAKVEILNRNSIENFNNLKGPQKNALNAFFYIVFGIFGGNKLDSGFDMKLTSDLTIGAGTGSSASYAVCLAGAMLFFKKGIDSKYELSLEDKILISKWAFNCERIMHGTPSGIDNTTVTFGSLVSFRKGQEPDLLDLKLSLRVLLVDSQVSRQTQQMARNVRVLIENPCFTETVACVMDGIDHISKNALKILQNLSSGNIEGEVDDQYKNLAELWDMNHCLLASLGVSHPALESIKASAAKHGLSCKLTGAGGGGYTIVLIPPKTSQAVVAALTQELTVKGYKVSDTTLGGKGVTLDP